MSNVLGLNYSDESSGDDDEEEQKPLPAPVASAPPPLPPPPQTKADHNVKVVQNVSSTYTFADFVQQHVKQAGRASSPAPSKRQSHLHHQSSHNHHHHHHHHLTDDQRQRLVAPPVPLASLGLLQDIDGTASDANPQLQQKLERWLALKASQGANFNRSLMSTREYRNPHMYRKLVEFFDLNEHGTNYPPDAFDPRRFPQGAYYEELGNAQRERMQAVAERQQQRSQIAFVAGGPSRSSGR